MHASGLKRCRARLGWRRRSWLQTSNKAALAPLAVTVHARQPTHTNDLDDAQAFLTKPRRPRIRNNAVDRNRRQARCGAAGTQARCEVAGASLRDARNRVEATTTVYDRQRANFDPARRVRSSSFL
jgi:hypothetical protein